MNFNVSKSLIILFVLLITHDDLNGQGFGKSEKLTDWYFHLGDVKLGGKEVLNHSSWELVQVPHDWSVDQYASPDLASCTGYLPGGIAWYRQTVNIPADHNEKRKYLYFGGVYKNSEVYVNGNWIGKRPNGYVSFMYDITDYVKFGEENVIAVRVDHQDDADSRWYTGSGIYRDVYIVTSEQVHIDQWGVFYTSELLKSYAKIRLEVSVTNHLVKSQKIDIFHSLIDKEGREVASTISKQLLGPNNTAINKQEFTIKNPKLWRLENPYLYTLHTIVTSGNKVLEEVFTPVGIRKLTFNADKGFALNDEWMKVKGVCLHHDAGVLGAAVPREVWKKRVMKLKEIGVNAIRMSHNPQSEDLYDICDELGMLVMDEAFDEWEYPKKKWIEGWNKGEPGFQGAAAYFHEWAKTDLRDMILRNRNHPSVMMWSIGNEVDYPNDPYSHPILNDSGIDQIHTSGYKTEQPHADRLGQIAKELAEIVRKADPSRPVTAALAGAVMSNETEYPGALDVVGYNYTESRYDLDHELYPNRILYGSETRHDMNAWLSVRDKDHIFGQFIWTGFDYLGESGAWPSRGFRTGMVDQANNIKARGYFRKSLWDDEPNAYLGAYKINKRWPDHLSIDAPHIWNFEPGDTIRAVTYTNGDEAELWLNGEQVGERKAYDTKSGIIYWDVPFEAGILTVKAFNEGNLYATDTIITSSAPIKISAQLINQEDLNHKGAMAMIDVQLIDENGNLSDLADNLVNCKVIGDAQLIGLENASHFANEDFNSNKLRCKNGKLLIYLKTSNDHGHFGIILKSAYLDSEALLFEY